MLKARVATASILLVAFLCAVLFLPTRQFALVIDVVVAIGALEWATMTGFRRFDKYAFVVLCAGLFAFMVWGVEAVDPVRSCVAGVYGLAAVFWIIVVPVCLATEVRIVSTPLALPTGVLVIVPAGLSVVSLHSVGAGVLLLFVALVWISDTAAFFAGHAFGRRKLAPSISPGKTWEGVAGALAATLAYAGGAALVLPQLSSIIQGIAWIGYLLVVVALCVLGILGDLFESWVKRQAKIKDSGTLLPGHGGVLDRIDSITSTLPVAAFIIYITSGGMP